MLLKKPANDYHDNTKICQLKFANEKEPTAYEYLSEKLKGKVAAWVDAGPCPMVPTTMLDFTETPPRLLRQGGGHIEQ